MDNYILNRRIAFGRKLKELRELNGHTQKQMSVKSKIAPKAISLAENGKTSFEPPTMQRLCKAYSITPDWFYKEPESPKSNYFDKLKQLVEWREKGLLTKPEFEAAKSDLLKK